MTTTVSTPKYTRTTTPTTIAGSTATPSRASYPKLLLVSLGATVAAGVVTEAWVAVMRATGVDLRLGDLFGDPSDTMRLPGGACATSIAMCMVLGTLLAVLINWRARRPAYTYVVTAAALTFVSLGAPLVSAGASGATKFTLIVAHLLAAAVIVPLVARCLAKRS